MSHKFVVLRRGVLETYNKYEDIPLDLDHVIEFNPEIPPPPHSQEQHEEIDGWFEKFKRVLEIEKSNGCNSSSTIS
jgi:hypothetical protein